MSHFARNAPQSITRLQVSEHNVANSIRTEIVRYQSSPRTPYDTLVQSPPQISILSTLAQLLLDSTPLCAATTTDAFIVECITVHCRLRHDCEGYDDEERLENLCVHLVNLWCDSQKAFRQDIGRVCHIQSMNGDYLEDSCPTFKLDLAVDSRYLMAVSRLVGRY